MPAGLQATLSVLSWNVFNENPDAGRISSCLEAHDADVVLLQEATPEHLDAVKTRYAHVATAIDYLFKGEACHLAIASRAPLRDVRVIEHFPPSKRAPTWFGRMMGWTEFLESVSAEIEIAPGRRLRLICAHTSAAASPSVRMGEVQAVGAHIPAEGPCLFAADFNCFAHPANALGLALPLGYRWRDFKIHERKALDRWFAERGFAAAVRGVTFPRFRAQMDQVYLRGAAVRQATIIQDRFGSDHRPIRLELAAT